MALIHYSFSIFNPSFYLDWPWTPPLNLFWRTWWTRNYNPTYTWARLSSNADARNETLCHTISIMIWMLFPPSFGRAMCLLWMLLIYEHIWSRMISTSSRWFGICRRSLERPFELSPLLLFLFLSMFSSCKLYPARLIYLPFPFPVWFGTSLYHGPVISIYGTCSYVALSPHWALVWLRCV